MNDTALSNAIRLVAVEQTDAAFAAFVRCLLQSRIGLIATNLPANRGPDEAFRSAGTDHIELGLVSLPDGRTMVKACADPATFVVRFPDAGINLLIEGRELLRVVYGSPELDGVLVCSAIDFKSVPIARADISRWLDGPSAVPPDSTPKS